MLIAAVLNVAGAFLSTEVAKTISGGIVNDALVTPTMIFAGLVGAILWNLMTWFFGLPSSSSHALFGGLIGAVLVGAGASGVNFSVVVSKILLPALSPRWSPAWPPALATFILYKMIQRADDEPPAGWFRRAQTVSGSMIALAHGTSDGQKTMGVITLVLITAGYQESGHRPAVLGDRRRRAGDRARHLLRWLADHADDGQGPRRCQAPQGFAAETTSAAAILASSHMGFGLSTTQVCSGSIIGSGVGKKLAEVRWGTARKMVYGWLLTLPAAALVGGARRRHRADRHHRGDHRLRRPARRRRPPSTPSPGAPRCPARTSTIPPTSPSTRRSRTRPGDVDPTMNIDWASLGTGRGHHGGRRDLDRGDLLARGRRAHLRARCPRSAASRSAVTRFAGYACLARSPACSRCTGST